MKEQVDYISGLDLGQVSDYTALAVIEKTKKEKVNFYSIRHLERYRLDTSYPKICDSVVGIFAKPPLKGTRLAVDQTGVGRAVVDMLRQAKPEAVLKPITITAGSAIVQEGSGFHIPKKELVSAMQTVLQGRRLLIAKSLPMAAVLMKELEVFKVKITASANETFEAWRSKDHDDLCLAVMMALWIAERGSREFWML